MPIKGVKRVRERLKQELKEITDKKTYEVLWRVGMLAGGFAANMTPVDTGFLINSQFQYIGNTAEGMQLRLGYTARYAEWVHDMPGKLKGQPRKHFGKTREGVEFGGGTGNGNYWDPNAEPEFLRNAFEDPNNADDIYKEIVEGYKT
ncbi:hypothetical protein IGP34_07890 [Escherichia coli]|uniref:hypothetical protein n=1 Tax=Escherichia coli TaxID=562 RepID=UPI00227078D7|nr:hypothetical protein [Escherichia coli]MCX9424156.1 hypothetical protein [Escherichia coli]HBB8525082.1 hypothetical protein [Escherichia coli]